MYCTDANAKLAIKEQHGTIRRKETMHPESSLIVVGDFNHSNLKTSFPKFCWHVSCTRRGDKTLDHVDNNMSQAVRTIPFLLIPVQPLLFVSTLQVHTTYKTCETFQENSVARGNRLSTNSLNTNTRITCRWPSRQTTSPLHSSQLMWGLHGAELMHIRLLALTASLDACTGPVLGKWLRSWLTSVTGPSKCLHVLQTHLQHPSIHPSIFFGAGSYGQQF